MRSTYSALVCVALLLGGCAAPAADESPVASAAVADDPGVRFHGVWELASIVRYSGGGEELSRNETSTGFIIYAPPGYMGVVIQGADRQPYAGERATPEEMVAAYRSYTSYSGGYTVDPEAGTVTHHLRASLNPGGAGSDYVRQYSFGEGEFGEETLTLQPPAGADGGVVKLTWKRVSE